MNKVHLERRALAAMLQDNDFLAQASHIIIDQHFTKKTFQFIYKVIAKYYKEYKMCVPEAALRDQVNTVIKKRKQLRLYDIIIKRLYGINVKTLEYPYLLDELSKQLKGRELISAFDESMSRLERGDINEAETVLKAKLASLQNDRSFHIKREGEYFDDFEERVKQLEYKRDNPDLHHFAPTGLMVFDEIFGGLNVEELGVVMGGPGKGKSIMLMNFALASFMRGWNVVVVTIEIPKLQYEYRLDARFTQIHYHKFRLGNLENSEMKRWRQKLQKIKEKIKSKFYILDVPKNCTADFLAYKLAGLRKQLGENCLLVIDYMNLMTPSDRHVSNQDDWRVQGQISREVKTLARDFHIGTWTAAQPTRKGGQTENMVMEDVGRAYEIPQNVDFMLGLVRNREQELENKLIVQCLKGRDGKFPNIELTTNFDFLMVR